MDVVSRYSIPVVPDIPTNSPKLGFERYVSAIAAAIRGGNPARFTVGIYGPWGSGKSSILEALVKDLSSTGGARDEADTPIVVRFDAWRYSSHESIALALLTEISSGVKSASLSMVIKSSVREKLDSFSKSLSVAITGLEFSLFGLKFGVNAEVGAKFEGVPPVFDPYVSLQRLSEGVPEGFRIIVLVDDLDRCPPDKVAETVDALHVLTDIDRMIFVLALDYAALRSAVESRYPKSDPDRFIEKIVQVPFSVPSAIADQTQLDDLIPSWIWDGGTAGEIDKELFVEISRVALRSNPRQMKRMINSYMLSWHIGQPFGESEGQAAFDSESTLKVLGLQLAWPFVFEDIYRDLNENRATLAKKSLKDFYSYEYWSAPEDEASSEGADTTGVRKGSSVPRDPGTRFISDLTRESRRGLLGYLQHVLSKEFPAERALLAMKMAASLAADTASSEGDDRVVTRHQGNVEASDPETISMYEDFVSYCRRLEFSTAGDTPSYFRLSRSTEDRNTISYGRIYVRRLWRQLKVDIALPASSIADLEEVGTPEYLIERVSEAGPGEEIVFHVGLPEDPRRSITDIDIAERIVAVAHKFAGLR